jgi:DivIVA domain-containing protein
MPLLPAEISAAVFRRRWWRGYDRHQVQSLLREVATDYGEAIEQIAVLAEERARARADSQTARSELEGVRQAGGAIREQAERDGDAIRKRAEQIAAAMLRQTEESVTALTRHTESLRAAAQYDSDAARRRMADADQSIRQAEDAAWKRWDALRAVERRMDQRIRQASRALDALRSRVSLLDQVNEVEELLTAIRADVRDAGADPHIGTAADTAVAP